MSKWIKCSEQMPPSEIEVLILTPYGDVAIGAIRPSGEWEENQGWVKKDMFIMDTRYFHGHDAEAHEFNIDSIKCWQPLPEISQE